VHLVVLSGETRWAIGCGRIRGSRRGVLRGSSRTTPRGVVLVFRVCSVNGSRSSGFAAPPAPFARWTMASSRSRLRPAWYSRVCSSRGLAPSHRDLRPSSGSHARGSRRPRGFEPTSHEVFRPFSAPTRRIDVEEPHTGAGPRSNGPFRLGARRHLPADGPTTTPVAARQPTHRLSSSRATV